MTATPPAPDPADDPFALLPLSDAAFGAIRQIVYDRLGVNLTEQKRSLVVGRLQKHVRSLGLDSFEAYCDRLAADRTGEMLGELVNRITTNHTFFFRERDHFDFLRDHALPEAVARQEALGDRDLRIWCAGCATGEEAYTIAMVVREFLGAEAGRWQAGVLATDVSDRALATARRGVYPAERVHETPPELQRKYFRLRPDGQREVTEALRAEITFRKLNLRTLQFPFRKPFHLIFCRNVMIYFDTPTREALVDRFYEATLPGGYLFIGHSESLQRERCPYRYVRPALYQREGQP